MDADKSNADADTSRDKTTVIVTVDAVLVAEVECVGVRASEYGSGIGGGRRSSDINSSSSIFVVTLEGYY